MKILCKECGGWGVAEIIEGWERPCDVCHGDGTIKAPLIWAIRLRLADWLRGKIEAA